MLRCTECLSEVGRRGRYLIHTPTHFISTYYEDEPHIWIDDTADRCDLFPKKYGSSDCIFYSTFETGMSHDQHYKGKRAVYECL